MKFKIDFAMHMFNCGLYDKSAFEYEVKLATEWYTENKNIKLWDKQ